MATTMTAATLEMPVKQQTMDLEVDQCFPGRRSVHRYGRTDSGY